MNVLNSLGLSITSESSRTLTMPVPSDAVRMRSATSNSGSPKNVSAPSCSKVTIERTMTPREAGAMPPYSASAVALDVGHEDRHARLGELAGHQLQGLGLARSGRPGNQGVPIEHRQSDLDANVGQDLVTEQRTAEHDGRLVERVAGGHVLAEGRVHAQSLPRIDDRFSPRQYRYGDLDPTVPD